MFYIACCCFHCIDAYSSHLSIFSSRLISLVFCFFSFHVNFCLASSLPSLRLSCSGYGVAYLGFFLTSVLFPYFYSTFNIILLCCAFTIFRFLLSAAVSILSFSVALTISCCSLSSSRLPFMFRCSIFLCLYHPS